MKLCTLILILFLSTSPLLGSDYLTIEQQNEEMDRAFKALPRSRKTQEVSNSQSSEFLNQIFPTTEESQNSSSVMTLEDWEHRKKHTAETMFHRLNDALNFLLTNREFVLSAILKDPNLICLTTYTTAQSEDGVLSFDFPLSSVPHPVAYLAQGCLILKEYQCWIDFILLFKNTAFPQHTLSSYDHNAACALKGPMHGLSRLLDERIKAYSATSATLSRLIDHLVDKTNNHDAPIFININHSFNDLLKGCLQSIDDALPRGTVTQINIRATPVIKNTEHMIHLGKNRRESVFEKLAPRMRDLLTYFSENYTTILRGIRSMAVTEYIVTNFTQDMVSEVMRSPFYAAASNEYAQLLEANWNYDKLFNGLKNNMISVQKIRKELGLPKEIFKGLDFEKEMQKALKSYELARKTILIEQPQTQETEVYTEIKKEAEAKNLPSNQEKIRTEPKGGQQISQQSQQIGASLRPGVESFPNVNNTAEKSIEEGDYIFDSAYFKLIHQYHQNQKNQTTTSKLPKQKLSEYEMNLYSYLIDNIFRPKQRLTWSNLVSGLTEFGFKGKPNTSGNGSTWEFSVTEKNELFFSDLEHKGATFNVHEFKGNEPIHPRYLKFFQSGFSNVFGLTEKYIGEALGL